MANHLELRHLRYFVAVAEAGSLTVAAEQTLHTSQPSLSRQIRDLEYEVGAPLMTRSARGVELTAAGKVFLDHARLALAQVDVAVVAARRAARPAKQTFTLGFLTGQEMDWMPDAMRILRDELPSIDITVSSHYSPELAEALAHGTLDLAFMRAEQGRPELAYRRVSSERLVVVLASDHPLASRGSIAPADLAGQSFIQVSQTAPTLRTIIDTFFARAGLRPPTVHEADNLGMFISLVASTRSVALLPLYAQNFLPWSVVSRPLALEAGEAPSIDLVVGYRQDNASSVLSLFLSRLDDLVERVSGRAA